MLFIVMAFVKCSVSFKFSSSVQSIRRSYHPNNAMIFDQNLFNWFIPCDIQMLSPSKWAWLCAVTWGFLLPPLPQLWFSASNEHISKWGIRLNKFCVPYQNSHINIICDSQVLSKLQGTYICSTFSKNRGFQRRKSWEMSTCHKSDM